MRILLSGFDPFGGQIVNPAWEIARRLAGRGIEAVQLPTVYGKAFEVLKAKMDELHPDCVICLGQAGGRSAITPEMIGVNLRYASIPDNEGNLFRDVPILEGAPAAYFATMPVRKMAERINSAGIPGAVSLSAGTFVCNDLLYLTLHSLAGSSVPAGFIHVPFLPEQGNPNLPLETMLAGIKEAINAI